MITVCILATQIGKFALWGCPSREIMERAQCAIIRDLPTQPPTVVCVDPVAKKIVYSGKGYPVQEA